MNIAIKGKVIPKIFLGAIAGLIFSICYFSSIRREVTLFILLGFLVGIAVSLSSRIYSTKRILYTISFGTLGGILVVIVDKSFNLMEITTAYPIVPFLMISVFIAIGIGLAEKSLSNMILRLVAIIVINYLVYAILVFAILMTYGMGFGIAYREIPMFFAFIIAGAFLTLGIGVADFFEEDVIFSKAFWIVIGIGILLLWLLRHWIKNISGFLCFLPIIGGYSIPLLIPTLSFYGFIKGKKVKRYLIITTIGLIFWFFWALFWFQKTYDFTSYIEWEKATFTCLIVVFISMLGLYMRQCLNILKSKNTFPADINKKNLWRAWFVNFAVVIISIFLYRVIENMADCFLFGLSLPSMYDIFDSVGLSLQWIIFTLPATLKINSILSKEAKISEMKR